MLEEKNLWLRFVPWFMKIAGEWFPPTKSTPLVNKILHTFRVIERIGSITTSLKAEDRELAKVVALFHDLGRFPQFKQYETFDDHISLDHADLSCQLVEGCPELQELGQDKNRVLLAIKLHNKLNLPSLESSDSGLIHAIRDADKLDIIQIVATQLTDLPGWKTLHGTGPANDKIRDQFRNGEPISYRDLRSVADLYMMILRWIYDLHFDNSIILAINEGYLSSICRNLSLLDPSTKSEIDLASEFVKLKPELNLHPDLLFDFDDPNGISEFLKNRPSGGGVLPPPILERIELKDLRIPYPGSYDFKIEDEEDTDDAGRLQILQSITPFSLLRVDGSYFLGLKKTSESNWSVVELTKENIYFIGIGTPPGTINLDLNFASNVEILT